MTNNKKVLTQLILIIFIVMLLAINITWINRNTAPPMWDQSWYLETSVVFYYVFQNAGIIPLLDIFSKAFQVKAPLLSALPLPFFLLVGANRTVAMLPSFLFIILFNLFLFALTEKLINSKTALIAVITTSSMPLVFGLSRNFLVDYGLATFVIMFIYFLLESNLLRNKKYNLVLGTLLGFGLLMKVTFPIYTFIPSLIILLARIKEDGIKKLGDIFADTFIILFLGLLIASSWYWTNFNSIRKFVSSAGFGKLAQDYSAPIIQYWLNLINSGISSYLFFALILLSITYLLKTGLKKIKLNDTNILLLFFWFIIPFLILSVGTNKDIRFMVPALPVIGITIAILLSKILQKTYLTATFLIFPIFVLFYTSFDLGNYQLIFKKFTLLAPQIGMASRPITQYWPIEETLESIISDTTEINKIIKIKMAIDHPYYNVSNFQYYKSLHSYPFEISTTAYISKNKSAEEIADNFQNFDYLIMKTGVQGPDFTNFRNDKFKKILKSNPNMFIIIKKIVLPDNSEGIIYKNKLKV